MAVGCVNLGSTVCTESRAEPKTYTKASVNKEIKQLQKDIKNLKAKDKKQKKGWKKKGLILRKNELPYYWYWESDPINTNVVYYYDLDKKPSEQYFYVKSLTTSQLNYLIIDNDTDVRGALKLTSGTTTWQGHTCNQYYLKYNKANS